MRAFAGDLLLSAHTEFTALKGLSPPETAGSTSLTRRPDVFPSLLTDNPPSLMAAQIAESQHEHITLLAEAQRLSTELVRCTLTTCTGDLWMRMLEFFGNLEKTFPP